METIKLPPAVVERLDKQGLNEKERVFNMVKDGADYFASLPPGPVRARKFLDAMDEMLGQAKAQMAGKIPCKAQCSKCCHLPIAVLKSEAELLASAVSSGHAKVNERRLEKTRKWDHSNYEKKKGYPCPFLGDDHNCMAYEYRPSACRMFLVVYPDNSKCSYGGSAPVLNVENVHVLAAALANVPGELAEKPMLANMVYRALKKSPTRPRS